MCAPLILTAMLFLAKQVLSRKAPRGCIGVDLRYGQVARHFSGRCGDRKQHEQVDRRCICQLLGVAVRVWTCRQILKFSLCSINQQNHIVQQRDTSSSYITITYSFDVAEKVIQHFLPGIEKINITIDIDDPEYNFLHQRGQELTDVCTMMGSWCL